LSTSLDTRLLSYRAADRRTRFPQLVEEPLKQLICVPAWAVPKYSAIASMSVGTVRSEKKSPLGDQNPSDVRIAEQPQLNDTGMNVGHQELDCRLDLCFQNSVAKCPVELCQLRFSLVRPIVEAIRSSGGWQENSESALTLPCPLSQQRSKRLPLQLISSSGKQTN
jgi:hypothetical protein